MASVEAARKRIEDSYDANYEYYNKVYQLRCLVAGSTDPLMGSGMGPSTAQDIGHASYRKFQVNRPDILVKQFTEGRNNSLLNLLGTLMLRSCFNFPSVRFNGLSAKEQIVNAQYVRQKLGPRIRGGCHAMEQGQMALMDFLTGGIGAIYLPIEEGGTPGWDWADTLDLKWDVQARLPCDMRWFSITKCNPLWFWLEMMPDSQVLKDRAIRSDTGKFSRYDDEKPVEIEFYYDTEQGGHLYAFLKTSDNSYDEKPVYEDSNPHKVELYGKKVPFLPLSCVHFMGIPSARQPIGVAEKMLPAQIAVWRLTNYIKKLIDAYKPFLEVNEDAISSQDADNLEKALIGGIVRVKADSFGKAFGAHGEFNLPQSVAEELSRNTTELNLQSGISSNALGGKQQGVRLATEVRSINQQAELMTGAVNYANARMWSEAITMLLSNGKSYDTGPFECLGSDDQGNEATWKFGKDTPFGPVSRYLNPMAVESVEEDSMLFAPRSQRQQQSVAFWQMALQMSQVPNPSVAVMRAWRKVCEAFGEDDPAMFEPPKPPMMPAMPEAQPGQMGSAQMGLGSTAM